MKSRFKKQLYFNFVLPPATISIFLWIILIWKFGFALAGLLVLPIILVWLYFCVRSVVFIDKLRYNLVNIENGSAPDSLNNSKGISANLGSTLSNIFQKLKIQEGELQGEKLRRLRSVIDGQDQERQRLSRELHDGIGQSLIGIKLQLENAETQNYSMMRAGIDTAKNRIDNTIEDVRRVCNALMPAALSEFGIVSTIRALSSELGSLAGFSVDFENEGSLERISKKSQIYLYRIAQEALNNIAKHARATHVNIKLKRSENIVSLDVSDNGKGFIFDPICFAQRNGLQNMRERTLLLQGEFTVNSDPGNGTIMKVSIPYTTGNGKDQTDISG
jgi:signal transduction histidine kinase